jgi:uncharacterized protein
MHLMETALDVLQSKGQLIMDIEREAALAAILLHDLGHGPFSHVLEYEILKDVDHEAITELLIEQLNEQFGGRLSLCLEIFKGKYHRKFFHQLISSQLDMDRLDYLSRDSFYTGVVEGSIGAERIIKMLNVVDNELVIEEKGLLSVESFLVARRVMYWQVYLHKVSISAEVMLENIFERIKFLIQSGSEIFVPFDLKPFLTSSIEFQTLKNSETLLKHFIQLDDHDIWFGLKTWMHHTDISLSTLCKSLLNRRLFKVFFSNQEGIEKLSLKVKSDILPFELPYFMKKGHVSNMPYMPKTSEIKILTKNGTIKAISEVSDLPTIQALSNIDKKYYVCFSNDVYLRPI